MKKRVWLKLSLIAVLVLAAIGLVACNDIIDKPEDYTEVTHLSIESANIFMAPNTTKQLEIKVHPTTGQVNAALTYYIPSKYTPYCKVSQTGLITALRDTPEGEVVPITVTSTSNKNAYLTVNLVIETVEVDRIYFSHTGDVVMYIDEVYTLRPQYEPAHASAGRMVTYESLNPEVISVDSNGVVTPVRDPSNPEVGGGYGSVRVELDIDGRTVFAIAGFLVKYREGSYRLESSDRNPQYNQVLGEFQDINFRLLSLNPNSDPKMSVYWFVDSEHINEFDNEKQFMHRPSVQSCTSYRISVKIKTQNEPEVVLESELITIYNPFRGFELSYGNLSSARQSYGYGEIGAFELTESVSAIREYEWYIKRLGESGTGVLVATVPAVERRLERRLNLDGDYVVTAVGKDVNGNIINSKSFEVGVTRFIAGDTLLINPVLAANGLPPESYNFFMVECDVDGAETGEEKAIGSCVTGDLFYYTFNRKGYYKIIARAVLDGKTATVGGKDFVYKSNIFDIGDGRTSDSARFNDILGQNEDCDAYRVKDRTDVDNIKISGIYHGDEYKALISWDNVGGRCGYLAEVISSDGKVFIFDSDDNRKETFGNNYLILPVDCVQLNKPFSVRIKQKGSLYSMRHYYAYPVAEGREEYYFAEIPKSVYGYLGAIEGNITGYATGMKSLGELLNYVVLYRPTAHDLIKYSLKTVDNTIYDAYSFNVYPGFDLEKETANYPVDIGEWNDKATEMICKAVVGAQTAYCPAGEYRFAVEQNGDGGFKVTVMLPDLSATKSTPPIAGVTRGNSVNYSSNPYGDGNSDFAIDIRQGVPVHNSEQLYSATERGDRPVITNDKLFNLYTRVRRIINGIIGKEMTDLQKALAFYDYLTLNVIYDQELADLAVGNGVDVYSYDGFMLEGVFDKNKAVCDGLSKAYVLMCAIEGIPALRVTGTVNGAKHAWNKVFIDGIWYVIDITNGILNRDNVLYTDHRFFLLSDADYAELFAEVAEYGDNPIARVTYDYYGETRINGNGIDIKSDGELENILESFAAGTTVCIDLRFDRDYLNGEELSAKLNDWSLSDGEITKVIILSGNRAIVCIN